MVSTCGTFGGGTVGVGKGGREKAKVLVILGFEQGDASTLLLVGLQFFK